MSLAMPSNRDAPLAIVNGNWGATDLRAVHAVLKSAYDVLSEAFGQRPDEPVRVYPWNGAHALTVDDRRPYEVFLAARERYWCQYVYQFSHELCHVMTRFDLCKGHRHKWFEESLCELASLFVLHRLAQVWTERPFPDIPGAAEFAPHHRTYAKKVAEGYDRPVALPEWLAENVEAMQMNPCNRDLNGVVALALLDGFLEEPSLWPECAWLNRWDAKADETFHDHLDSWTVCLRESGLEGRTPAMVKKVFGSRPDVSPVAGWRRTRAAPR